jgi:uncharacterized repeat protein (TIGR03803 family)
MSFRNRLLSGSALLLAALAVAPIGSADASTTNLSVLFNFSGGNNGGGPVAGLVMDASGNLYGTTLAGGKHSGDGTVFELSPISQGDGVMSENVLYNFSGLADGKQPGSTVVADSAGNLYGTTSAGGIGAGTVFQLVPPTGGSTTWTEKTIYTFSGGSDGGIPVAGVVFDSAGNLYGTTKKGGNGAFGTVFKLAPPTGGSTAWTESVLYSFTNGPDGRNPTASLAVDGSGRIYGTTVIGGRNQNGQAAQGTVFQLVPPPPGGTSWGENVLYTFSGGSDGGGPASRLTLDSSGSVYGTTKAGGNNGVGTVFELSPPVPGGSGWTEQVLYSFAGNGDGQTPIGGVTFDQGGNLWGTTIYGGTFGRGTVFRLGAPSQCAPGWVENVVWNFSGGPDGANPRGNLLVDVTGALYGTTSGGVSFGSFAIPANRGGFVSKGNVFKLTYQP